MVRIKEKKMAQIELPYLASRDWLQAEILAGNPTEKRRQALAIDTEELSAEVQKRVESILTQATFLESGRVRVLESGIDPEVSYGPDADELVAMDEPVIASIGELPELPKPTDSVQELVEAWETWLDDYHREGFHAIKALNEQLPPAGHDRDSDSEEGWGTIRAHLGHGIRAEISPTDGAGAMQNALASWAWERQLHETLGPASIRAASEATEPSRAEALKFLNDLGAEDQAARALELAKDTYITARAHDRARRKRFPDFDAEMRRWALERGSERLRLGIEDGYRMNARYLAERLAQEAPGFYAMDNFVLDDWASRANSPSEQALLLRRRVAAAIQRLAPETTYGKPTAEICVVHKPPAQMYEPEMVKDDRGRTVNSGYPSKQGWPWRYVNRAVVGDGPRPFEAIVVEDWLGRFNLIGAVGTPAGDGPRGIWAIPKIDHYDEDGMVVAQDPDVDPPPSARRKPPEDSGDDDIPF
jgi:hypothetical protein